MNQPTAHVLTSSQESISAGTLDPTRPARSHAYRRSRINIAFLDNQTAHERRSQGATNLRAHPGRRCCVPCRRTTCSSASYGRNSAWSCPLE